MRDTTIAFEGGYGHGEFKRYSRQDLKLRQRGTQPGKDILKDRYLRFCKRSEDSVTPSSKTSIAVSEIHQPSAADRGSIPTDQIKKDPLASSGKIIYMGMMDSCTRTMKRRLKLFELAKGFPRPAYLHLRRSVPGQAESGPPGVA
jgi:hypothetical protein